MICLKIIIATDQNYRVIESEANNIRDSIYLIRHTLKAILIIDLTETVWNQATLPVSSGGLGVRLATDLLCQHFCRQYVQPPV